MTEIRPARWTEERLCSERSQQANEPRAGRTRALVSYAAIGLMFVGAAAADSGDYALIVPNQSVICAKSERSCEAAREAIRKGWLLKEIPRNTPTQCIAWPGCFSEKSNCIEGHNCK